MHILADRDCKHVAEEYVSHLDIEILPNSCKGGSFIDPSHI